MSTKLTEKQIVEKVNRAIKDYHGDSRELESAIGVLWIGRQFGWRPIFLMHQKKTIKKYQEHLGIDFRDAMPEVGPYAKKSIAWFALEKISDFWKAVKGEISGIRTPGIR